MEAKDTVMGDKQLDIEWETVIGYPCQHKLISKPFLEATLRSQAEITWKARDTEIEEARKVGYDEGRLYGQEEGKLARSLKTYELGEEFGIRKVVEWVNKSSVTMNYETRLEWQAKLKEWIPEQKEGREAKVTSEAWLLLKIPDAKLMGFEFDRTNYEPPPDDVAEEG